MNFFGGNILATYIKTSCLHGIFLPFSSMEHSNHTNIILLTLFKIIIGGMIKPPHMVLCVINEHLTNTLNMMFDFSHNET